MISTGDRMPSFRMEAHDGQIIDSESLAGTKTVIYFYPADSTPGCTAEACNLRDNYGRFLAEGHRIIGVSKNSLASHRKFALNNSLPFPLLSDPDHVLMEQFGAWGEKKFCGKVSMGTLRRTYVFDSDLICTKIIEKVDTKNHSEQIL